MSQRALRSDVLTFDHHRFVAPLAPAQQRKWLARAVTTSVRTDVLSLARTCICWERLRVPYFCCIPTIEGPRCVCWVRLHLRLGLSTNFCCIPHPRRPRWWVCLPQRPQMLPRPWPRTPVSSDQPLSGLAARVGSRKHKKAFGHAKNDRSRSQKCPFFKGSYGIWTHLVQVSRCPGHFRRVSSPPRASRNRLVRPLCRSDKPSVGADL